MAKCSLHPSLDSTMVVDKKEYCGKCQTAIESARQLVDRHVSPKDCFVWFIGGYNWQAIPGTGCAHYVAHQLKIKSNSPGERCLEGFLFRVSTLVERTREIKIEEVRLNDIYVTPDAKHTGIVCDIVPAPTPAPGKKAGLPKITIRHASSGQGKVADNDFATYFKGVGTFRRV